MDLVDVYEIVVKATVAFVSKIVRIRGGSAPILPQIIGTGFLVSDDGIVATNRHVLEAVKQIPSHPDTGESGYGAVVLDTLNEPGDVSTMSWMMPNVASYGMIDSFSADSDWYGESIPDIGFAQLEVRGTPFLELAKDEFYIKPGTSIATAGFPMGGLPLTVMRKVNQVGPFIRRGIVSSVFPFSIPRPHGFTIDIMQQGGSSGSPIFYEHSPVVVGMMAAAMTQPITLGNSGMIAKVPTNISIAISSHMIGLALQSFRASSYWVDPSKFPTLQEWKTLHTPSDHFDWNIRAVGN